MKIKELIDKLSSFDSDENITFYFLGNNTLTNCQLEDIDFYSESMGVEVTIQDTADMLNLQEINWNELKEHVETEEN